MNVGGIAGAHPPARRFSASRGEQLRRRLERFGDVAVDPACRTVTRSGNPVNLAPKEFDLLMALIRRRGAVVTRLELLEEVWGYSAAVITRTVDTHVAELRRKLEDDPSSPRYILTARKAGYRLQE